MRRGTAKKHAPESGLIGSVCYPGGALLASSKAPKRTSRAAWSGISLLPKLAMRSMLRRGKKRRPRVKDYVGAYYASLILGAGKSPTKRPPKCGLLLAKRRAKH